MGHLCGKLEEGRDEPPRYPGCPVQGTPKVQDGKEPGSEEWG